MLDTIQKTNTLSERLREHILRHGPMTFCDWMNAALYEETHGYYCRADTKRWGREGDYRTSPERSGLFAATFARYFSTLYDKLERPSQWTIVEAGAGDGNFAFGVLSTLKEFFPQVFRATRYVIDEVSTAGREALAARLEVFGDRIDFAELSRTEVNPGIVFSNELLDAFPVHRVTWHKDELLEFYVGIGPDGQFSWLLKAPSTERLPKYLKQNQIQLVEGQVAEINLAIEDWLTMASSKLARGYLVTVDYGLTAAELYSPDERFKGTLRSFKRHQFVDDMLANPGEQDLTSTVNWSFVESVGTRLGLKTIEFQRQDKFLLSAGLLEQLRLESDRATTDAERMTLSTAAREMILPDGMAASFQVLVQMKERSTNIHEAAVWP